MTAPPFRKGSPIVDRPAGASRLLTLRLFLKGEAKKNFMTGENLLNTTKPLPVGTWLRVGQTHARRFLRCFRSRADIGRIGRTRPVSINFGDERGQIVDRYYIEKFLAEHAADVRGHVLEFGDDSYTRQFGGARATKVDVLQVTKGNPRATIVADLAHGEQPIPSDTFDCIICTQVLQYIYDLSAGIRTLYRILKPGGAVLITAPCIQKIDREDMEAYGEYWRFTSRALRQIFEEMFPRDHVDVRAYGNVLAATAFLYGLAVEDLRRKDLEFQDPDYEVTVTLRAVKPPALPWGRP